MNNQTIKKLSALILLLAGMFISPFLNAQNCPANKVWACRYDECGIQECKCVNANSAQNWMATIPQCNIFHPNCCGSWRTGQNEPSIGIQNSLQAFPNPVSHSTTISFSLEQSQHVSIGVYAMNGKLVSILANEIFEEGENELIWNPDKINGGIYFLHFQSEANQERVKLIVTK